MYTGLVQAVLALRITWVRDWKGSVSTAYAAKGCQTRPERAGPFHADRSSPAPVEASATPPDEGLAQQMSRPRQAHYLCHEGQRPDLLVGVGDGADDPSASV